MQDTFDTLDIKELFDILFARIKLIIFCCIGGFILFFVVSKFVISPQYTSYVAMYVNNSAESVFSGAVNINDLNASQKLVNTYIVILQDDEVIEKVSKRLSAEFSYQDLALQFGDFKDSGFVSPERLRKVIKMSSVNNTEVLKIESETKSPELSARICTIMTEIAPDILRRVVKAGSVEVIGEAKPAIEPSSPNVLLYTIIGFVLGAILSCVGVLLHHILDRTVKGEEDLKKLYNIPILGEIPDLNGKSGKGYSGYEK